MDFEHTKKTKDLMSIVADFINTHIKPAESIYAEEMETYRREGDQWRVPKILYELKEKAKGAGLWNFSLTGDLGYGLTNLEFAPLAEMMGVGWTSEVFNSSAPDAGNMEVLDKYGIKKESRTGYSIGIGYPPDWGEQTLNISKGDKTVLQPNVTFHMIAVMQFGDWGVEASESVRVTKKGSELFCNLSRDLHIKG